MMRSTKLVSAATVFLTLWVVLAGSHAAAQEIPQPIGRPCKHPCVNKIRFANAPRLDSLELHARIVPLTSIDPPGEAFTVEISNVNGVIFTATLNPGSFLPTNADRRFIYRNAAARTAGGIYRVQITQRKDPSDGYRVDLLAYGDLSAATVPEMTTVISIGGDGFFDTSMWGPRQDGWVVDFLP